MATWLDILSEDMTDGRGRFNPFKLGRAFTSRGRAEVDRAQASREVPKQEILDQIAREQAARQKMAGGVDLTTFQPRTPEEVDMLNRALSPQVVRGNLASQDLGRRQGEQALSEATALQPARVEGAGLANQGAAQAIQYNAQLQPGRVTQQDTSNQLLQTQARGAAELLPFQVGAADLGNQTTQEHLSLMRGLRPSQIRSSEAGANAAEFGVMRDAVMLPGQMESQAIGNETGRFNLRRGNEILPRELQSLDTRNRSDVENLVTQLATQDFVVMDAQNRAEAGSQTNRENQESWPLRRQALENQSKLDPRVVTYLNNQLTSQFAPNPRAADANARQMLGLPVDISAPAQTPQNQALADAIATVARGRAFQPPTPAQPSNVPMPNGGQVGAPGSTNAPAPRRSVLGAVERALPVAQAFGRRVLQTVGNMPTDQELATIRTMLATPEGRQRLQQLYPSLGPSDKARIENAIKQLQGQ